MMAPINKKRIFDYVPGGIKKTVCRSFISVAIVFVISGTGFIRAASLNEWTFERDVAGLQLRDTINSGTNSLLAQFANGFGGTVFTTNRALLCIGDDTSADSSGSFTNGAVLNAALPPSSSSVHYLRYDVAYDLDSTNNNSGTVLGVYFTGGTNNYAAGLVLGSDAGNFDITKPADLALLSIPGATNLAASGMLTAVAEVNLSNSTVKIWYDLSGSNIFVQGSPAFTTDIALTTITNLRFHATGDFRPAGSTNCVSVDNIRHTTSWAEVIKPIVNLSVPPALTISVTNSSNGAMDIGETNFVTVIISNRSGGIASNATSVLIHDGRNSAFTVVSNNASAALLAGGDSITNTYQVIAAEWGNYVFTATGVCDQTNSTSTNFNITVLSPTLTVSVTNSLNGAMDVGETNIVTVVISNSGGATTNATSVLIHDGGSATFTVVSNNAPVSLPGGATVTNTYQVIAIERGCYVFTAAGVYNQTNTGAVAPFNVVVGANLKFLAPVIEEVSGGAFSGYYDPGETLNITITATNDGAYAISNIVSTLATSSAGFTVTPASASYAVLPRGAVTSTVYQVVIGAAVAGGTYDFVVTNRAGTQSWVTNFNLAVFVRQPNRDWVKANNIDNLNVENSWVSRLIPNNTDRAIFTTNITSALTTEMGDDLSWRGIALVSNTAAWTISGTNKLTIGSAGIDLSQAQADLAISSKLALATTQTWDVVTSRTLAVSGQIIASSTAPLIKSGRGALVLTNMLNSFMGGIMVSNGTLSVGNTNVLGNKVLQLNGGALATISGALLNNNIVLTNSVSISNADALILSGVLGGSGSLTKTGSGTLLLRQDNTYSGGTTNSGVIEIENIRALGTGPIVMNTGSTLQAPFATFVLNDAGLANNIELAGNATIKTKTSLGGDVFTLAGSISGPGQLTVSSQYVDLTGVNTFSGGLVPQGYYLRFYQQSLGSGPITIAGARILWPLSSMKINNDISLASGSSLRIYLSSLTVNISGKLSGAGTLDLQDLNGTVILSGDNALWSGNITKVEGIKTLQIDHTNAFGTGTSIDFGGGDAGRPTLIINAPLSSRRNMQFGATGHYPVEFQVNQNAIFSGNLTDGASYNDAGVWKTGAAQLTLSGTSTYSGPTEVRAGSLIINGTLPNSAVRVASGATLGGTGSVQAVTMDSGSTLDLSQGLMTFNGGLALSANSLVVLGISGNSSYSALKGNGANEVSLQGTLKLDFTSNTNLTAGNTFTILNNWAFLSDNGVKVTQTALPGNLDMDTSRLFIDGTVSLVTRTNIILTVAPDVLILKPAEGGLIQKTVTVSNVGDVPLSFALSDNAIWNGVDTAVAPSVKSSGGTAIPLNDPAPSNSFQNAADSGESDTISIGFPFPFYGAVYTNLYIDSNGAIIFSVSNRVGNTSVATNLTGHLPLGSLPMIAPFRHVKLFISDANPVRYVRKSDRLVLIYSGVRLDVSTLGTNLQFQAELFTNGQIKLSYYNINGSQLSEVAVGMQGDAKRYVNVAAIPASGNAVLLNSPDSRWVTYSPLEGTVSAHSSTVVTFTADGTAQSPGTSNSFDATFNWLSGGSDAVSVNASVVAAAPVFSAPSVVLFYGNAGGDASTELVLTNTGNAALNFTITDSGGSGVVYQSAVSNNAVWSDISSTGTPLTMLKPSDNPYINATNEGFSALQPIGFAFPFYGNIYTQFSAGVNGGLSLGSTNRMSAGNDFGTLREDVPQRFIAPYWGNLLLDSNEPIRFLSTTNELIVSWQNMGQSAVIPGTNLAFQAVLYASGRIEFHYRIVNGSRWPVTKWGIRSSASRNTFGRLILPGDEIITTNEYGYAKTNYMSAISRRAVAITSSNYPVITYTPAQGSIAAGGTSVITLHGNAVGLTAGGANSITNRIDLNITYEAETASVGVIFVATNSVEPAMAFAPTSLLDEDGDGMSYDDELTAGTDPLSADSVFTVYTVAGRVLSWPSAPGRTYTVLYTLDLKDSFIPLAGASGLATNVFTDTVHSNESVIYYKVTVE